jgi:uncharacterized repeat protein (TIGR03803 family)
MHNKGRFPNVIFGARLQPEGATLAIVLTLLGLIFVFLFMTLTAQLAQGQSAQNAVPPTARQAAASPAFAQRLAHPSRRPPAPRTRRRASPLGGVLYNNGPANGTVDAWAINFGYAVANSFTLSRSDTVTGFDFYAWAYPGDTPLTVDWSITSAPFGGTTYGSGTVSVTDTFISSNQYGYDIDLGTATGSNVSLGAGTYFLNLQNATTAFSDPLFWDENSGPSYAEESSVGSIPSEAFDVTGGPCGYNGRGDRDLAQKPIGGAGHSSPNIAAVPSAAQFQVIYNFTNGADGQFPWGGLTIDSRGNLYGGASSVFKLAPTGSGWIFNPLYSPGAGALTIGPDGAFYAASEDGLYGQIVRLAPPPTACKTALCSWTKTVLYQFQGGNDGVLPNGFLVFDEAGNIYGTTQYGGGCNSDGCGTVYKLTRSKAGWTESVLYRFTGESDGAYPRWGVILDKSGDLYGTTYEGGDYTGRDCTTVGCGTLYQLTPSGSGWTLNILHTFLGGNDGANPNTAPILSSAGDLYGSTQSAGQNGGGTVFEMSPSNGTWTLSTLHAFSGYDGPTGLIMDGVGNLYGTTYLGGSYKYGNVFKLAPESGGWTYTDLYDFNVACDGSSDGFWPDDPMVLDTNGNLFGSSGRGGTGSCDWMGYKGCGVVWEITP